MHDQAGRVIPLSRSKIISVLEAHGVDHRNWKPPHRTLDDLVQQHTKDQIFISDGQGSQVILEVHTAVVIVLYKSRSTWLELYEDHQLFPDGSILRRSDFNGIGETLDRHETPQAAAIRCLREELSFYDDRHFQLSQVLHHEQRGPIQSEKWPEILAKFHRYIFECWINSKLFKKGGYREIRNDGRIIFFKWKPNGQYQLHL